MLKGWVVAIDVWIGVNSNINKLQPRQTAYSLLPWHLLFANFCSLEKALKISLVLMPLHAAKQRISNQSQYSKSAFSSCYPHFSANHVIQQQTVAKRWCIKLCRFFPGHSVYSTLYSLFNYRPITSGAALPSVWAVNYFELIVSVGMFL